MSGSDMNVLYSLITNIFIVKLNVWHDVKSHNIMHVIGASYNKTLWKDYFLSRKMVQIYILTDAPNVISEWIIK